MREFFFTLLQNLDMLTGHRQYEKLRELPNYKEEINRLLDVLCRVSNLFPFIPDDAKKNIISDSIITDLEFTGLNARIVYKWFNMRKDIYFKEIAHIEKQEQHEPVSGEKREEWLKIWQQELAKVDNNFSVRPVSNAELMREKLHGQNAEPTNYIPDPEQVQKKKLHQEYIKANYDPITGNCLETWIPEDQWIKKIATT